REHMKVADDGPVYPSPKRAVADPQFPVRKPDPDVPRVVVWLPPRGGLRSAECDSIRTARSDDLDYRMQPRTAMGRQSNDAARWLEAYVPPAGVRSALREVGLSPATVGTWLAPISPWAGYAALRAEKAWGARELQEMGYRE